MRGMLLLGEFGSCSATGSFQSSKKKEGLFGVVKREKLAVDEKTKKTAPTTETQTETECKVCAVKRVTPLTLPMKIRSLVKKRSAPTTSSTIL
ncbi:Hypothetical protein SMAX5B_020274 [Scophthalmus maximus]|uniref:Uncharacterized protein n=1 Tax=Scophthalmus maximus TaxID=52904 RepID=A0A2U9CLE8_SCOMX|nr:Hypothetical protein SMAX5B_020274 [Scophthalmus maximus]KAF0025226.1 hypothetical protein F2P81_022107 [Scophthalmus maximus]